MLHHQYFLFFISWSSVLLEKRIVVELVKKFLQLEGSIRCSQKVRCILCPSHTIYLRSILILSFHHPLYLLSGIFPLGFPSKTFYLFPIAPRSPTYPAHTVLLEFIALKYSVKKRKHGAPQNAAFWRVLLHLQCNLTGQHNTVSESLK
jgi:hypothetical protein